MPQLAATTLAVIVLLAAAVADALAKPGDLDRRFGNDGLAKTRLLDGGWAGTVDRRGRILVAGGVSQPGVLRLRRNGRRDRRFGNGGVSAAAAADELQAFGIRRSRSGVLHVAAWPTKLHRPPVELLRFRPGGRPLRGRRHKDFLLGPIVDGAQRPDGGVVVLTRSGEVRAIRPDGATDAAFGDGGRVELARLSPEDVVIGHRLARRGDGRVVVTLDRYRRTGQRVPPLIVQLTRTGALDPSFGGDGTVPAPFVSLLAILRGGDVLVGHEENGVRLARFSRSGARRRAFGRDGVARGRRRNCCREARDVVEDRRGRLYVLTDAFPAEITAFNRAGRRVRRFGRRGAMRLRGARRRDWTVANDLLADGRGGLLVVGHLLRGGSSHPSLGCAYREDVCATDAALAVWRVKR